MMWSQPTLCCREFMKMHLACLEAQEHGTLLHWCRFRILFFYRISFFPAYPPKQQANCHSPSSELPNLLWSTHFCWSGTGSRWGERYVLPLKVHYLLLTVGMTLGAFSEPPSEHQHFVWSWQELFREWSTVIQPVSHLTDIRKNG